MRFSFKGEDFDNEGDLERLKWQNYRPLALNKNVSEVGMVVEASDYFWSDHLQ
jgi:hypothetical protein